MYLSDKLADLILNFFFSNISYLPNTAFHVQSLSFQFLKQAIINSYKILSNMECKTSLFLHELWDSVSEYCSKTTYQKTQLIVLINAKAFQTSWIAFICYSCKNTCLLERTVECWWEEIRAPWRFLLLPGAPSSSPSWVWIHSEATPPSLLHC